MLGEVGAPVRRIRALVTFEDLPCCGLVVIRGDVALQSMLVQRFVIAPLAVEETRSRTHSLVFWSSGLVLMMLPNHLPFIYQPLHIVS